MESGGGKWMVNEGTVGSIVKKKFVMALFGGFLLFGILLASLGFSGTIFAVPLGGMGDFYVSFDKLEGEGFTLNPQIGETGTQDAAPMVRNEIKSATIDNLHIYKDLQMPTGNWIRVNIKASQPTSIDGLIQDARFIDANLAFDDMAIKQTNSSQMSMEEAYQRNWTQDAEKVTITDAKIVTDYLFQNMVTLNGAVISIDKIEEPEQTVNKNVSDDKGGSVAARSNNETGKGEGVGEGSNNDDAGDSNGGFLPETASNWLLPIIIGVFLSFVGLILILRKRKNMLNE